MRIITYNVNGIRAAMGKGLINWMQEAQPDVLCVQEIKANPEQVGVFEFEAIGYHHYWYPAQKKGYSGVALFSKEEPKHVEYGCGVKAFDDEGRIIRADFKNFSVMSAYHPSGTSGEERQSFKMEWLRFFNEYAKELKSKFPNLILSGDYNICHTEIDIHNPKQNQKTSGFLPEEREWMTQFISNGFIDSFRAFHPDPHHYTWWSNFHGARGKNLGWRIDYHMVSDALKNQLSGASILPQVVHSDHCPAVVELTF